jgi:hypothetical protein
LGANNIASNVAAVAIGESNNASGINSIAIGYQVSASATYSMAIGFYSAASGTGACAFGLQASATRPGQFAHSSGTLGGGASGGNAIDLANELNAVSGTLQDNQGGSFVMETLACFSMRVRVMAVTVAGAAKRAHEVRELLFVTQAGPVLVIDRNDLITNAAVNFASQGWSLTIAAVAGTDELRFTFNPGADHVRVLARLEWSNIGNL